MRPILQGGARLTGDRSRSGLASGRGRVLPAAASSSLASMIRVGSWSVATWTR